jgi:hypothetical protein
MAQTIEEIPASADTRIAPGSSGAADEPIYHAMSEALPTPPPIYQPAVQNGPPAMGVPSGPLPPSSAPQGEAEDSSGKPVFLTFEQLSAVLGRLSTLLPPDARFSFNHDSEKAWIVAANGLDLHPLVEQALAELGQKIEKPESKARSSSDHSVLGA